MVILEERSIHIVHCTCTGIFGFTHIHVSVISIFFRVFTNILHVNGPGWYRCIQYGNTWTLFYEKKYFILKSFHRISCCHADMFTVNEVLGFDPDQYIL